MYVSMCTSAIFLILILVLYITVGKVKGSWFESLDKKENRFIFLYPLIDFLITRSWIKKRLERKRLDEGVQNLYVNMKSEDIKKVYYCQRISPAIMILILTSIFTLLSSMNESKERGFLYDNSIIRPDYGEGSQKVDLSLNIEDQKEDYNLDIGERRYTESQLEEVFDKAIEFLESIMLGENQSQWEVYKDLNFIGSIPETSILVEWFPEDYSLINSNGRLVEENLPAEGVKTSVTVKLIYFTEERRHEIPLFVIPQQLTKEESIRREVHDKLSENLETSKEDETISLPTNLNGYDLHWQENKNYDSPKIMFLGLVAAFMVFYLGAKEVDDKQKKRKDQMLADYPDIVNKFTLLLNAGMTLKQAWYRVADEYSKANYKRYAYEEILYTAHRLKLGLTESEAYDEFGRRCNVLPYLRFSSLLSQNLKKGSKGLGQMLRHEAAESLNERKEIVKRYGEEASTKLLFPMMILLIIVLLIVIIPVFISF